ncbi:hypothetical protein [Pseudomonas asiatica]|nr:hypothetical protein [Pseudomonas asiatica]
MKDDLLGDVFGKSLAGKYIIDLVTDEVIDIKSTCKIVDVSLFDTAAGK